MDKRERLALILPLCAACLAGCSDDSTSSGACPPTAAPQLCVEASRNCCPEIPRDVDQPKCVSQIWTCGIGRLLGRCDKTAQSLPTCGAPSGPDGSTQLDGKKPGG